MMKDNKKRRIKTDVWLWLLFSVTSNVSRMTSSIEALRGLDVVCFCQSSAFRTTPLIRLISSSHIQGANESSWGCLQRRTPPGRLWRRSLMCVCTLCVILCVLAAVRFFLVKINQVKVLNLTSCWCYSDAVEDTSRPERCFVSTSLGKKFCFSENIKINLRSKATKEQNEYLHFHTIICCFMMNIKTDQCWFINRVW